MSEEGITVRFDNRQRTRVRLSFREWRGGKMHTDLGTTSLPRVSPKAVTIQRHWHYRVVFRVRRRWYGRLTWTIDSIESLAPDTHLIQMRVFYTSGRHNQLFETPAVPRVGDLCGLYGSTVCQVRKVEWSFHDGQHRAAVTIDDGAPR